MKKVIIVASAAAFLGSASLVPTPASAYIFLALPAVLAAKKDPNFKQVNPYAPQKIVKKRSKKRR